MSGTTIVLADDHAIVRQGLRALLQAEPQFTIVGEANDGVEAIRLVQRTQPRVLIVDLMMTALNGLEVTRQVHDRWPQIRVVVLSMLANEAYVLEALRHGAGAYVLKDSTAADLVKAVREVLVGRRYLSAPFSNNAIQMYVEKTEGPKSSTYETLTSREREVFQLAAEGNSNGQIACRLFISPRTAEIHKGNMMRKLGLHNQADLTRYAIDHDILSSKLSKQFQVV